MTTLLAWVAYPLCMLIACTAVGALIERAARLALPSGLLPPLGACGAILLTLPAYKLGGSAPVAAVVLVVATVAGVVLGRRRTWERGWWGPYAALGGGYLLYMAPVLLSGHWTWAGYNFVNDTSVNLVIVDHLMHHGDSSPPLGVSTTDNLIAGTFDASYPLGFQALYATLSWLVPIRLEAVYQPFIAVWGGLAAMALAELGRRARIPALPAAAAGVLAVGASLTYNYSLHGAVKEVAAVGALAAAACAARVALDEKLAPGAIAAAAIALSGAIALLSGAAGAYALVLGALMLLAAAALERERVAGRRIAVAAGVAALVLAVTIAPFLDDAVAFGEKSQDIYASTVTVGADAAPVLGHLLRPLPAYQGLGTWIRDDYRLPLDGGLDLWLTRLALVVAGLLALGALVLETVRRRWVVTLAAVPAALVYAVAAPRLAPYADAKLLMIASPLVVFAAAAGAWWLARRIPVAGALAALVLVVGIGYSDALAYNGARLAPADRMEALADAADHAGGGRWLFTEFEEFAKYFGRDSAFNTASEPFSPRPAELVRPGSIYGRSVDLDEMTLPYVQSFDGIVLRRGPTASRPPDNFSLAYRNEFYELWRRGDGPRVAEHLPLGTGTRGAEPSCRDVRRMAGRGGRLVAVPAGPAPSLDITKPPLKPPGWAPAFNPGLVAPLTPARIEGEIDADAGRYRAWLRGSSGRDIDLAVDGKPVGAAEGVNAQDQYMAIGTVDLDGGSHDVELVRPGGGPAPGNGFRGELGPLVLEPLAASEPVTVEPSQARRLCGRSWDWIDRVEG